MKQAFNILLTIITGFSLISCEEMVIGPQPKFIGEDDFQEGLNVFSIITNEISDTISPSFVYLENTLPTRSEYENMEITATEADVFLSEITTGIQTNFIFQGYDELSKREVFRARNFRAIPGNKYKLECLYKGDTITGMANMPHEVQLVDGIKKSTGKIRFTIKSDSTARVYLVVMQTSNTKYEKQVVPFYGKNSAVSFNAKDIQQGENVEIRIYAYDQNLAEYLSTTNVFIMPNAYRPIFSTVENGFGVFGAICKTEFEVSF